MKKTIKVNLGGIVFQLDEDAYDLLREYLDRLEARFSQLAGGNEILNDIEVRMAELFSLRLTSEREVVNLTDAREVTAIMGDPAEIGDGEEEPEVESTTTQSGSYRRRRRFYRDPDNQVIGGVCSGLGAYFNLDPVIIRVLFVMFTLAYGTGLLVYLILWIGMPEARTSAEKLEMHGEEINVLNIERRVRQDYDDREFLQSGSEGRSGRGRGAGDFITRLARGLVKAALIFTKIILGFVALILLITGITILVALVSVVFGGQAWFIDPQFGFSGYALNEILGFFVNPATATLAVIAMFIILLVPLIILIMGFLRLVFNIRFQTRTIGWSAFGVWVIALILLIVMGTRETIRFASESRVEEETPLEIPVGKALNITTFPFSEDALDEVPHFNYHNEFWILREQSDSLSLLIRPRVTLKASVDTTTSVEVIRISRGTDASAARRYAREIDYNFQLRDTLLALDPVFRLDRRSRFQAQEIRVVVKVPIGTTVYLDSQLKELLYAVKNTEDTWSSNLVGREWVMTPDGLSLVLSR